MNTQIEAWRVIAFKQGVFNLSQQMGSRLAGLVRQESFIGKSESFDRLGEADAQDKTGRHEETPDLEIDHSRRWVTTITRHWGTLVDKKDKLQNIQDVTSQYQMAARNGLGRKIDDVIIAAALGTARTGEENTGTQALGTGQKVVAVSGGAQSKMNVAALRKAKMKMDAAEVPKEGRYFVHDASSLENMLAQTETTSADYNTVKALVNGELNTFLGFTFIHSERVLDSSSSLIGSSGHTFSTTTGLYDAAGTAINADSVSNFCFQKDGIILGKQMGTDFADVSQRKDKSFSWQVYVATDAGAVRLEEARVVEVICRA